MQCRGLRPLTARQSGTGVCRRRADFALLLDNAGRLSLGQEAVCGDVCVAGVHFTSLTCQADVGIGYDTRLIGTSHRRWACARLPTSSIAVRRVVRPTVEPHVQPRSRLAGEGLSSGQSGSRLGGRLSSVVMCQCPAVAHARYVAVCAGPTNRDGRLSPELSATIVGDQKTGPKVPMPRHRRSSQCSVDDSDLSRPAQGSGAGNGEVEG